MVEERITDGRRIAQLLASEVDGREGDLAGLAVTRADRDVEPTPEGARAYDVSRAAADADPLAVVYVQPDRVRVEVTVAPDAALDAAREADLRARPRSSTPPAAVVFVESGAESKRAADVLGVVANR
jgi:hypothetical protein